MYSGTYSRRATPIRRTRNPFEKSFMRNRKTDSGTKISNGPMNLIRDRNAAIIARTAEKGTPIRENNNDAYKEIIRSNIEVCCQKRFEDSVQLL